MNGLFRRSILVAGCVFWSVGGIAFSAHGQDVLNGMAAVVNSDVVTFGQVRELVGPKEKHARETLKGDVLVEKIKEIRLAAINDLIDRALILQEFKSKGFVIPPYLIDERVNEIVRDSFGGDRQAFLRTLSAQELTLEKFREFQRDSAIVQEMRKMAVKGATTVSEPRIQDFYREHLADYSSQEEVKLRMITLRGAAASFGRRKLMEEIRGKVADGADFSDMARLYSDTDQETFGDVGWVDRKHFNEELTKTAFALKPGEVSKIIEVGDSLYLISCEAKKDANIRPLTEVRPEIEKALLSQDRQKQQQEWMLKLRKKAYIKLY